MRFDLYCAGVCDTTRQHPLSAAGLVLVAYHDDGSMKCREFSFGLGPSSANLAEIQAARLAFAAVNKYYRHTAMVVHTNTPYLIKILTRTGDKFDIVPLSDSEAISGLRRLYTWFLNVDVILANPDDRFICRAKELAAVSISNQFNSDSGLFRLTV